MGVILLLVSLFVIFTFRALASARLKAFDPMSISDVKNMQLALELYRADHGRYPAVVGCKPFSAIANDMTQGSTTPYLPPENFSWYERVSAPLSLYERILSPRPVVPYEIGMDAEGKNFVLRTTLIRSDHTVLTKDLDGAVLECDCDDPNYCVVNKS